MQHIAIKQLTQAAMMLALSTVLSLFALFRMPFGGEVTLGCMVPIFYYSFRYPGKPALLMSFSAGLMQLLLGSANVAYGKTAHEYLLIIFLDYIFAYGILGIVGSIKSRKPISIIISCLFAILIRYGCHLLSGFIIWEALFGLPDDWIGPYWLYNLTYNSFVLIDGGIAIILLLIMQKLFNKSKQ